jgi:hypothetical protein
LLSKYPAFWKNECFARNGYFVLVSGKILVAFAISASILVLSPLSSRMANCSCGTTEAFHYVVLEFWPHFLRGTR